MRTRTHERVATASRTSTFQMPTEAINLFIQQSLNDDGLPFIVTTKSKTVRLKQAVNRLMSEIDEGVASVERGHWIDESEVLSEFGALR